MGRRGQWEQGFSLSISDAMPALQGRRCVGTVQSGHESGKQGGTAELFILSLFPQGNKDFFYSRKRSDLYDKKSRQTMA